MYNFGIIRKLHWIPISRPLYRALIIITSWICDFHLRLTTIVFLQKAIERKKKFVWFQNITGNCEGNLMWRVTHINWILLEGKICLLLITSFQFFFWWKPEEFLHFVRELVNLFNDDLLHTSERVSRFLLKDLCFGHVE